HAAIKGDDVPCLGHRAADQVVRRAEADDDAIGAVPQRSDTIGRRADKIPLHDIIRDASVAEVYPPPRVAGDDIPSAAGVAPDDGARRTDDDAVCAVTQGDRAGRVGPDVVPLDDVAGRAVVADSHPPRIRPP